jgi:hypothetical protein
MPTTDQDTTFNPALRQQGTLVRAAALGERDGIAMFQKHEVYALYVDGSRPIVEQLGDPGNTNVVRHFLSPPLNT